MSVSRDFIDSYSPEAPAPWNRSRQDTRSRSGLSGMIPTDAQCGGTTLVFGFHGGQDLLKALISLLKAGRLLLALGEELLQRLVQPDRLVDLRARPGAIRAEPDQLFHVGI